MEHDSILSDINPCDIPMKSTGDKDHNSVDYELDI
jgi:hypothetical protein